MHASTKSTRACRIVNAVDLGPNLELFVKQGTMIWDQDAMHLGFMEKITRMTRSENLNNVLIESAKLSLMQLLPSLHFVLLLVL